MKLTAVGAVNRDIKTLALEAALNMAASNDATNIKWAHGAIPLTMGGNGKAVLTYYLDAGVSDMAIATSADPTIQGEAVINLAGLILAPGDELIINTQDMTVTINGRNGMQYFSVDSDFFSLLSGSNTIVYSDTTSSRNVLIDIIWKDRWL